MMDALRAYNSILTDMPVSQKSFDVAKSNSLQNLATKDTQVPVLYGTT